MSTIDNIVFEKAGARGCSNSGYNLVETTCCHSYMVEDDELNDVYFDPSNLGNVIEATYSGSCPICGANDWDYIQLNEWPREPTNWQWAYHSNQEIVNEWLNSKP